MFKCPYCGSTNIEKQDSIYKTCILSFIELIVAFILMFYVPVIGVYIFCFSIVAFIFLLVITIIYKVKADKFWLWKCKTCKQTFKSDIPKLNNLKEEEKLIQTCSSCKTLLRVPKNKGLIDVTCPICKATSRIRT